jgi:hypothetical protein
MTCESYMKTRCRFENILFLLTSLTDFAVLKHLTCGENYVNVHFIQRSSKHRNNCKTCHLKYSI